MSGTSSTRVTATGPVLTLTGDLDAATAPEAQRELARLTVAAGQLLVVDLTAVAFCDSSGINALIAARNIAVAADADLALVAVPRHLDRVLVMIGLASLFTTYATVELAVADHAER
ncbi:STAS domain-containing protein [Amycolatopsis rhabdoformis]|uniref:Anti-sigma factor antagonist n=1 Tax=Amycolatopsis rhabdoformis TaxID=1448059 RepID=A0ABZ1IC96_9PSEU|nr:STAS domain-containing protein [Amycolatopsis rhabdoformis]WSE32037.1 STAS domain-containing protein [Amycolatopsis rhabdoformis]